MYWRFQAENFFVTTVTHNCTLNPFEDWVVDVQDLPAHIEEWKLFYVVFKLDDESRRFTLPMYVEDWQLKYHWYDVHDNYELLRYDTVCMNDLAENLNYLFDNVDDIWTVHRKGGLDILVYGWKVTNWKWSYIVEDTDITLEDNTINHLVLDSNDCTIKIVSEVADFWQYLFADIETFWGEIIWIELAKAFFVWDNFSAEVFRRNEDWVIMINYDQNFEHSSPDLAPSTQAVQQYVDSKTVAKSDEAPAHPSAWDQWYDTNTNVLYIYNWTQWQEVGTWWGWGWSSLLWGWNAETWLPSALNTWYIYQNWDSFLVDNVNYVSYRKTQYGNYHIPTTDDLVTLMNIVNYLAGGIVGEELEKVLGIRNMVKAPVSSLFIWGLNYTAASIFDPVVIFRYSLFTLFRWAEVFTVSESGNSYTICDSIWFNLHDVDTLEVKSVSWSIDESTLLIWMLISLAPIRLFSDTPIAPDENRTELCSYWNWWSYWNENLWLISLSSDWETWLTIKDKNEWATETAPVFTDGLSILNNIDVWSWNFYQWWNCHWFSKYWPYETINAQSNMESGSVIGSIPFNYWNFDCWRTEPSDLPWFWIWVLTKDQWEFILTTLSSFWITTPTDISRYLKLPIAWYINGTDAKLAYGWFGTMWGYWCDDYYYDEDVDTRKWVQLVFNWSAPAQPVDFLAQPSTEWFNLRCIADIDIWDYDDWTVLYDWSSVAQWAWIFHSPKAQAILIDDGNESIIIRDRNQWAWEVYNYWDAFSCDNIWGYYQCQKPIPYYPTVPESASEYAIRPNETYTYTKVNTTWMIPYSYNGSDFVSFDWSGFDPSDPSSLMWMLDWEVATNKRLREYSKNDQYYWTNYKPNWSVYNWTPSGIIESIEISKWSQYIYLNWEWLLNKWVVNFSAILWNPLDNNALADEFDKYLKKNNPLLSWFAKYSEFEFGNNVWVDSDSMHLINKFSRKLFFEGSGNIKLGVTSDSLKPWMQYILWIDWSHASGSHYINFYFWNMRNPFWLNLNVDNWIDESLLVFLATDDSTLDLVSITNA